MDPQSPSYSASRRTFLKGTTAAVVGGSIAALASQQPVHASSDETLKVGLIGCGGRGSGAAVNAMQADKNAKLTAMGDAFEDRLNGSRRNLQRRLDEQYAVDDDHAFYGFDAFQQVIDSGVDVVLLASPPHFRPRHLRAAVEAGKHVFCEKPVAVDPTGVRHVLESVQMAKDRNLNIVSGLCWRYDYGVRETMKRIQDGAIGDITTTQANYLTGTLWHRGRQDEWSEMEYQVRNWLYFTWLSGDHIVEQHIHSIDKLLWLMNDEPPASCFGLGGRQVRTDEQWGNIYDHFAVCYQWPSGVKAFAYTRQMRGCYNEVEDYAIGSAGTAELIGHKILGKDSWTYDGPKPSMYDVEHEELFAAIRSGNPINDGVFMTYSTLMAIMGREACYTGQLIRWDDALNSPQDLSPEKYQWGDIETPAVPMPGETPFA